MLDIVATDGTHCYFNATHDQLADVLAMLAARGMVVEHDIRGAANSGRPIVTPPPAG